MASIYDVGTSALTSMQRAIATTGHNIANVNTEGYSRQEVSLSTLNPERVGSVEIGTGVEVSRIKRAHDQFLISDVQSRSSSNGYYQLYASTAQNIDGLLSDPSTGIAPAIDKFFAAMEAVAANPNSSPERQVMLSEAQMLASRFNYVDGRLGEYATELNSRMSNMTDEINALADDIARFNETIVSLGGRSGNMPNDLLDKRDLAIKNLSELVRVETNLQEDGALNVTIGRGQRLVIGSQAEVLRIDFPTSQEGPARLFLSVPSGAESEVTSKLTGGELGGCLDAGSKLINSTRREIGLLAAGITETFNRQHALGDDLNGQPGGDFFLPVEASVVGSRTNTGLVTVTATLTDETALVSDGYSIQYEGDGIRLTNLSSGASELVNGGVIDLGGFSIDVPANDPAFLGDTFYVEPTSGAAGRMSVALTDPMEIAAADRDGNVGDNRNVLSLIGLRDAETLKSGSQSYSSLFGATLSGIAVETRSAQSNAETEQTLLRSAEDRLEGLRGVNLDEEATNLIRYQQAYQAAAQVISVANDIFDTLLQASRR